MIDCKPEGKHTKRKIAKLCRLISSSSGEGFFPTWIIGGGASAFLCRFVVFPESPIEEIHISSARYESRKDVLKAVTHKMYGRLTSKKK